ncbi:MAG: RNase adapter RapZ [Oscillospiraceae bacterium]|nr:RNase adapter RapZ [Oscillospiraceae bacterium]
MQLVMITGMSGSGKSMVMQVMEDIGYYCIDNLPPQLIPKFVEICRQKENGVNKVAIAVDIRSGGMFSDIYSCWHNLKHESGVDVKVVFTEASEEVLIQRYKETRRKHPLGDKCGSLQEAIAYEQEQLQPMRAIADFYVETSHLSVQQLKEEIKSMFLTEKSDSLLIKVMSFGYKYGVSTESDLVLDVRCLPNPFYIPELKTHTGCESCVRDYVMQFPQSKELLAKFMDMLEFLLPLYISEGKSQLVIAFGCTGGKHRSITFAEIVSEALLEKGYRVHKMHRDITR